MHYTRTAHAVEFSYDRQTFRCEVQNYVKDLEGFWKMGLAARFPKKKTTTTKIWDSEEVTNPKTKQRSPRQRTTWQERSAGKRVRPCRFVIVLSAQRVPSAFSPMLLNANSRHLISVAFSNYISGRAPVCKYMHLVCVWKKTYPEQSRKRNGPNSVFSHFRHTVPNQPTKMGIKRKKLYKTQPGNFYWFSLSQVLFSQKWMRSQG